MERIYLQTGAVVKNSSGQSLVWDGLHFIGINEDADIKITIDDKEHNVIYAWDVPTGSQEHGKPYIEVIGRVK